MKLKKHSHYLLLLAILIIAINPLALSLGSYLAGVGGRFIAAAMMGGLIIISIIMWISFSLTPKEKIAKADVKEEINVIQKKAVPTGNAFGSSIFNRFKIFQKRDLQTNPYIAIIVFSVFLIGISVFYSFAYLPYKKDSDLKKCLSSVDNTFLQNQQQIDSELEFLKKNKKSIQNEIDVKLADFIKNNPEPENKTPAAEGAGRLTGILTSEHSQWERKRESIFNPMKEIERNEKFLSDSLIILEKEKKSDEEACLIFQ